MKILQRYLQKIDYHRFNTIERLNDIYATEVLSELLHQGEYLPTSRSALSHHSIAVVLNDIIINKRHQILEFGCGISTVLMARLFAKNQIPAKVISVEEDENWLAIIQQIIQKEDLSKYVDFVLAPLKPTPHALENNRWYDTEALMAVLKNSKPINLILVDGPTAYRKDISKARYPALPVAYEFLSENFVVYLDDTNRTGEQYILKKWAKAYKLKFIRANQTISYAVKGEAYNAIL
ncbi:MAG: class I SAM-dependent methyltransferase [Bernardetiaceae bacterium]|nr:class I SAM-dependent methyltransferase [Bernardetiaceae bacterium]